MEQAMTLEAQPDTSPRRGDRRKERSVTTRADLERAAHRYLQRYETTQAHLRTVLERRARRGQKASSAEGEPSAPIGHWIEEIVARCVEMRLVDDGRFAEGMVRRLHRQGASHRASWQKLRQKGVPEGLIAEQLGSAPDEQRELHAACLLARKRRLGPWRDAAEAGAGCQGPAAAALECGRAQRAAQRQAGRGAQGAAQGPRRQGGK